METVVGSTVSFHDINYKVPVKDPGAKCCGPTRDKLILQGINGIFKPGMNAILGPTGSGKTSLLDVLAARKDPSGLSGDVLIDGYKQPKNFKCMSGYVVQDDVVMGTLTVRENFMFSASLRLSNDVSLEEKKKKVEDTIQELGLSHCADSKVGTEFIRGVSGGERKRTNIGMELITSPNVLFLDEPTTGLDASTANAVMLLLHRLSKKGRTIIFSIHQPRYSIHRLFDSLMLLARGRTVYHGPSEEAIDFFSSIGHQIEAYNNPPDFFLDVINGDSTAVTSTMDEAETLGPDHSVIANGNGHLSKHVTVVDTQTGVIQKNGSIEMKGIMPNGTYDAERGQVAPGEDDSALANKLADDYARSRWNSSVKNECDAIHKEYQTRGKNAKLPGETDIGYPTSFGRQLGIVSKRAILNILRNPQTSFVQLFVMVVFAVVCGLIYLQVDRSYPTGIQNRVGAFFFIVMNQVFGNLSAVELFIKERAIFIHENAGGFYRVSAYFLAKVFCDVIPLRAIPVTVFSLIVYFMIGLTPTAGKFFFFVLVLALSGLAAAGLGFAISATVRVFAIANLLIALCYVFMMVFSGLLVNLESIGAWMRWIQYLSIFRYSLNALSISQLKDGTFCLKYDNGTISDICDSFGNQYLREQGIPYETAWDLWSNVLALGLLALFFMTLAYIQLRRVKKLK